MIFDTDIAIWMLRGEASALEFARATPPDQRLLSVVSEIELLEGCRNRREQQALEDLLTGWFSAVVPLDARISQSAVRLMRLFALSHRPGTADVLIAASALEIGVALATGNVKHFRFVRDLAIQPFKPPR